jgi:hypothetical protein
VGVAVGFTVEFAVDFAVAVVVGRFEVAAVEGPGGLAVDGLLTGGVALVEAGPDPPGPLTPVPAGVVPADGSAVPPLAKATVTPAAAIAQMAAIATTTLDRRVSGSHISSPSSRRG